MEHRVLHNVCLFIAEQDCMSRQKEHQISPPTVFLWTINARWAIKTLVIKYNSHRIIFVYLHKVCCQLRVGDYAIYFLSTFIYQIYVQWRNNSATNTTDLRHFFTNWLSVLTFLLFSTPANWCRISCPANFTIANWCRKFMSRIFSSPNLCSVQTVWQ